MMLNLDKFCRLCLGVECVESNLFTGCQDITNPPLYKKVMDCISVKIQQGDGLPALLCDACVDRIDTVWNFKQTSEHVDAVLKKILKENIVNLEERIKSIADELRCFHTNDPSRTHDTQPFDKTAAALFSEDQIQLQAEAKGLRVTAMKTSPEDTDLSLLQEAVKPEDLCDSDDDWPEPTNAPESALLSVSGDVSEVKKKKKKRVAQKSEHTCEFCGRIFARSNHLLQHELTHVAEKPFHCSDCGKSFWYKASLVGHVKQTHTGDVNYTCELCGKGFFKKTELTRHKPTHSNETPHKCPQCGLGFKITKTLKRHMRTVHGGQRSHTCDTCGKSFSQLQTLKVHMMLHTGEKPYVCSYCGKGFAQSAPLKSHVRTHTGEKPYTCHVCHASFTTSTSLTSHAFKHRDTLPYPCTRCSEAFRLKRELIRHMQGHHDEESHHGRLHGIKTESTTRENRQQMPHLQPSQSEMGLKAQSAYHSIVPHAVEKSISAFHRQPLTSSNAMVGCTSQQSYLLSQVDRDPISQSLGPLQGQPFLDLPIP